MANEIAITPESISVKKKSHPKYSLMTDEQIGAELQKESESAGQPEEKQTMTVERAKQIMGENFIGIAEARLAFEFEPTPLQLEILSVIPYSQEKLEECQDTHILIAVPAMSVQEMATRFPEFFHYHTCSNSNIRSFYDCRSVGGREKLHLTLQEEYRTNPGRTSWYLIRKNLARQEKKNKNETIVPTRVFIFAKIMYPSLGENSASSYVIFGPPFCGSDEFNGENHVRIAFCLNIIEGCFGPSGFYSYPTEQTYSCYYQQYDQ